MPRSTRTRSTQPLPQESGDDDNHAPPAPLSPALAPTKDDADDDDADADAHIPSEPNTPIVTSYTYASPVPSACTTLQSDGTRPPCILGVDEAGRGPVLGPLVYGIAYCPLSFSEEMQSIGFADSKALTAERRDRLLSSLIHTEDLGWSVRVMSPQDISAGMLRRRPINLNAQSCAATVSLIADVLGQGVDLTHIYVDTVGDPTSYKRLLASHFPRHPHIQWTVTSKADALFPIVGAASIAAKVTRDRCIEAWRYAELNVPLPPAPAPAPVIERDETVLRERTNAPPVTAPQHEGKPSKSITMSTSTATRALAFAPPSFPPTGSGYPSDPSTVAYLKTTLDPVFGWPGIVRFSWATREEEVLR